MSRRRSTRRDSGPQPAHGRSRAPVEFAFVSPAKGVARTFRAAPSARIVGTEFFTRFGPYFGMRRGDEMRPVSARAADRFAHIRFTQHYRGVPVIGGDAVLTQDGPYVISGTVAFVRGLSLETEAGVAPLQALDTAVKQLPSRSKGDAPRPNPPPEPTLVIVASTGRNSYRLAYRCLLSASEPLAAIAVDVDALNGEVLNVTDLMRTAWATGPATGASVYSGTVSFNAETDDNGSSRLREAGVYSLQTFDLVGSDSVPTAPILEASPANPPGYEIVGSAAAFAQHPGIDAHWAVEQTLEYFRTTFGQTGIDGVGTLPLPLYVHYGINHNNSQYQRPISGFSDPGLIAFGDAGDPSVTTAYTPLGPPLVVFDIVAHEVTHGVVYYRVPGGFTPTGESGAIAEGFADVFACLVQFAMVPGQANWQQGDTLVNFPGKGWNKPRDIQNPKSVLDPITNTPCYPDTYGKGPWQDPLNVNDGDRGGTHTNSTVFGHAFYLLAEGGQGTNDNNETYDVVGIGKDATARLAYKLLDMLPENASFVDAADNTVIAAWDRCGQFSQEHISAQNAWYAVGVADQFSETVYQWPLDGAMDVDPWDMKLKWQAGVDGSSYETSWDVEVSTTADFSQDVLQFAANTTDTVASVVVGALELKLQPAKTYAWRVRRATTDPTISGWRPASHFTTDGKQVVLISPLTEARKGSRELSGVAYPWGLEFSWKGVEGAEKYEVEVTDRVVTDPSTNQLVPDWTKLIFPTVETSPADDGMPAPTSTQLNVKVKSTMHWHARAVPPEGTEYAGVWSDPFPFMTSLPKATVKSPDHGDPVYPWPVNLVWDIVPYAARYVVELARYKPSFGKTSLETSLDVWQPTKSKPLNLKPARLASQESHYWRVRVFGPQPLDEEGAPSDPAWFLNDGDGTIPKPISTAVDPTVSLASPTADKVMWLKDGSIVLKWKSVKKAEAYRVRVMSVNDPSAPAPPQVALEKELHPSTDYDATASEIDFMVDGSALDPPPGVGLIGYSWKVIAVGPEGLESPSDAWTWSFCIWPDPPNLTAPAPPATDIDYQETINFAFTSLYSPSGKYHATLSDGVTTHDAVFPGDPGGTTLFGLSLFGLNELKPNTAYTWKARAHTDAPVDSAYPWSQTAGLTTKGPPVAAAPAAPNPLCPTGGEQIPGTSVYYAWSEVPGAQQYEFLISPPPYFSNSGDFTYNLNDFESTDNGRIVLSLGYDPLQVNTQYQWMVKANVNGVWSDWSSPATFVTGPSHWGDWNNDCAYP